MAVILLMDYKETTQLVHFSRNFISDCPQLVCSVQTETSKQTGSFLTELSVVLIADS